MKADSILAGDAVLIDTGVARLRKSVESKKPKAALGNMKAYLFIDDPAKHWISVTRTDLEQVLQYVADLEAQQVSLLQKLEDTSSE